MKQTILTAAAVACSAILVSAQVQPTPTPMAPAAQPAPTMQPAPPARPASPSGSVQTQVGGAYIKDGQRERYQNGKWIEISYSRPIKRGRDVFGAGADYGKTLNSGAPVWRAGANVSTRLKTEAPLMIAGKTVPAGEYSLFIELKSPTEWTLIVSSWAAKKTGNDATPDTLWGSFGYTPDKDVVRAPMTLQKTALSVDQLTWAFADVTSDGGKIAIAWDTTMAWVPFTVGK